MRRSPIVRPLVFGPLVFRPLLALFLAVGPAAAADPPHDPAECTCRGRDGRAYALGERTCLVTTEGPRLAECTMVLNNTSWRTNGRACPEARDQNAPATTRPTSTSAAQTATTWRPNWRSSFETAFMAKALRTGGDASRAREP